MSLELPQGFWYDSIDSTMDEARRLIQAQQIQGTAFVVAKHQAQGRGTQGRSWTSPDDLGIYLSVVHLAPAHERFETTTRYTLAAGVACVEAIEQVTGFQPQLKPINDIYAHGKKLGGILVESDLCQDGISTLITGVGINTHKGERRLDRHVIEPISLEALLPPEDFQQFSSEILVETLVAKICFWYALLFNGQSGQIDRAWERYKRLDPIS